MSLAKNLLLTGLPRVGKTTVVQKVLSLAKVKFGGFYTQAVDAEARQRDFKLVTLEGHTREFTRKRLIRRFEAGGLLGIDLADLESKGVASIRRAIVCCQAVVIDEIGRHEVLSRHLQAAVLEALSSGRPVLGTVPLYGTPFIEALKARSDCLVIEVTTENRVLLADSVAREIGALVRGRSHAARLRPAAELGS